MTDERRSVIEALEEDPRARGGLAAARLASMVGSLMETVEEQTAAKRKSIAAAMGVSAGRVTQILTGDGNVRIATLARFLDACGYELELTARPKSGHGPSITQPKPPRRRQKPEPKFAAAAADSTGAPAKNAGFTWEDIGGEAAITDIAQSSFPQIHHERRDAARTRWPSR